MASAARRERRSAAALNSVTPVRSKAMIASIADSKDSENLRLGVGHSSFVDSSPTSLARSDPALESCSA